MRLFDWHALYVNLWANLWELGASTLTVSLAEKILRPILVYAFLVVILRRFGQRILAQLNPFDLVVLLTLSNTVQNAIIGNDTSLSGGLIGAAALIGVNALTVRLVYRGPRVEHLLLDPYLETDEAGLDDASRAAIEEAGEASVQEAMVELALRTNARVSSASVEEVPALGEAGGAIATLRY